MKKLTLTALAAAILATSVAAPMAYAAPQAPIASSWSEIGSASEWTWALIRDGSTLDAHLQRYQPASLPIFETISNLTGAVSAQS